MAFLTVQVLVYTLALSPKELHALAAAQLHRIDPRIIRLRAQCHVR